MAINEPPPVYSSLSEMDNLYFRGEEAKKKSLFLSPFTARKEPKKFAVFHIVASLILFGLGAVYGFTVMGTAFRLNLQPLFLIICLPALIFFLLALFGIVRRQPNFLLPIAAYMITAFVLRSLQLAILLFYSILSVMAEPGWILLIGWIAFGTWIIPLLYTSHAARLYLRVRDDILTDKKERNEEIKLPLVL